MRPDPDPRSLIPPAKIVRPIPITPRAAEPPLADFEQIPRDFPEPPPPPASPVEDAKHWREELATTFDFSARARENLLKILRELSGAIAIVIGVGVWSVAAACESGAGVPNFFMWWGAFLTFAALAYCTGLALTYVITDRPERPWIAWPTAITVALALFVWWGATSTYQRTWTSETGMHYSDTYHRWSRSMTYRSMHNHSDSWFNADGPMAGTGKPHGMWDFSDAPKEDILGGVRKKVFYWYGEEITEGEWHLRNR